jgi:hypothetical protein
MKYDKVLIKQIPDEYAVFTGLHKYGRSKMPQTVEGLQAAEYGGRAITGLDEDAIAVNSIKDPVEKQSKKDEIKALRESLEQLLQKDLRATSPFWETFTVSISSDSDLVLNKTNPLHVVMYHMLIANGYVAPDKDSASKPDFRFAKYYCHVTDRVQEEEATVRIARDRIKAKLVGLYDEPERLLLIGKYLEGDKYKKGMSPKTLYNMLSTFVENPKEPNNITLFAKAVEVSVEDLQYKITIDRAIKKKVIKNKSGYYQIGEVTLGKSPNDVYENLKRPEFFSEFMAIQDQIEEII